jgi:hypothetical protein
MFSEAEPNVKKKGDARGGRRYGPYWREYSTDLDYAKVESVLRPETKVFEETFGQVFGFRTQKGLIQIRLRDLADVMVQISPRGVVMIYYSKASEIREIEDKVKKFIERLCGRPVVFAWVKSDPMQQQHYEDLHSNLKVDQSRGEG